MPQYHYNYPWSGRLGPCTDRCIYCGESGQAFRYSSHGNRCLDCDIDKPPIPELEAKFLAAAKQGAHIWCLANHVDYEATVANYLLHLGPPLQEREGPIPGADQDYTVYFKD